MSDELYQKYLGAEQRADDYRKERDFWRKDASQLRAELTAAQQENKRLKEAGDKLKVVVETCRYNARQGAGVDETASFPFFDAPLESWQQALGGDE